MFFNRISAFWTSVVAISNMTLLEVERVLWVESWIKIARIEERHFHYTAGNMRSKQDMVHVRWFVQVDQSWINLRGNIVVQSNMVEHRMRRLVHIVLAAAVLVVVVIYSSNTVTDKVTIRSILRDVPEVPQCQPLSAGGTNKNSMVNSTSCATGRPCTYSDVVDLRVIVITLNRPDSLSKLLRSLDTLVLDGHRAALEIWIDRDRKNRVDQRTTKVASAFRWRVGPTRVHVQVTCL